MLLFTIEDCPSRLLELYRKLTWHRWQFFCFLFSTALLCFHCVPACLPVCLSVFMSLSVHLIVCLCCLNWSICAMNISAFYLSVAPFWSFPAILISLLLHLVRSRCHLCVGFVAGLVPEQTSQRTKALAQSWIFTRRPQVTKLDNFWYRASPPNILLFVIINILLFVVIMWSFQSHECPWNTDFKRSAGPRLQSCFFCF